MLRWLFLVLAVFLLALGSLNTMKTPAWIEWRLAVLAGEFGHWLALVAIVVAGAAWWLRGEHMTFALATLAVGAGASGLLLKPAVQAWRIGATLSTALSAQLGNHAPGRDAFSWGELFFGKPPASGPVRALAVSPDLPLDFYAATTASARPVPCVIMVHGGGWNGGDRGQIPQFNHWLAGRGYAVAAISYRLAPRFIWPAQRDDVLAAIAFLKSHAAELRIDPTRLVLLGRSAGGQIALATAYTADDPAICAAVGLYAPSDLIFGYVNTHENDMLKSPSLMRQFLAGTPDSARANYESASALFHVTGRTPPTLLLHGENDALVWDRHSLRLDARLAQAGVPHAFISLPWATHAFDYTLHGPGGQLTRFALEWFLASVTQ